MIQEFIKEYRKLRWEYENWDLGVDADGEDIDEELWMCDRMEELVGRYENELNIQSLKELEIEEKTRKYTVK